MIISGMDTSEVAALLNDYYSIENTLKRRGFDIKGEEDANQVIQTTDSFYEDLKSFAFRQVLKAIYNSNSGVNESDILEQISNLTESSLSSKLTSLTEENCISKMEGSYHRIEGRYYSKTFEWFICEIIRREMCGIARRNVKILNLSCGGDFDIISRLEDLLIHIECKSGSVRNISKNDITLFLHRYKELAPSMSILIIDTNGLPSDFKAKFEKADWQKHGLKPRSPRIRRKRKRGVFYELYPRICVITGEGNIVGNIKLAINHYFAFVKPYGLIKPGPAYMFSCYDDYESSLPKAALKKILESEQNDT